MNSVRRSSRSFGCCTFQSSFLGITDTCRYTPLRRVPTCVCSHCRDESAHTHTHVRRLGVRYVCFSLGCLTACRGRAAAAQTGSEALSAFLFPVFPADHRAVFQSLLGVRPTSSGCEIWSSMQCFFFPLLHWICLFLSSLIKGAFGRICWLVIKGQTHTSVCETFHFNFIKVHSFSGVTLFSIDHSCKSL